MIGQGIVNWWGFSPAVDLLSYNHGKSSLSNALSYIQYMEYLDFSAKNFFPMKFLF